MTPQTATCRAIPGSPAQCAGVCAPASVRRFAEHGGGQQAGGNGDGHRRKAVQRRKAEGERMQVPLQPLALQRQAHEYLSEEAQRILREFEDSGSESF